MMASSRSSQAACVPIAQAGPKNHLRGPAFASSQLYKRLAVDASLELGVALKPPIASTPHKRMVTCFSISLRELKEGEERLHRLLA